MRSVAACILALGVLGTVSTASAQVSATAAASDEIKVIYHINDSAVQALAALRSMRNHLDTAPNTKIAVVTHADGIDFLATAYKDADTVGPLISGLAARGVTFYVCEITINRKMMQQDDFVLEADFVPSGVVHITTLQHQEGYAYIKP